MGSYISFTSFKAISSAFMLPSMTSGFFANLCLKDPSMSYRKSSSFMIPVTLTIAASIGVFGKYLPSASVETFLASIV